MKKLRGLAISSFRKGNFELAISLFSLAYEKQKNQEFLYFIELCKLAKDEPDDVLSLFEFYCEDLRKNQEENLSNIIEILESTSSKINTHINSTNGIAYSDFLAIVASTGDFCTTFENTIHSTRIVINSHEELANFISNLLEHGYTELAMHYLDDKNFAMNFSHFKNKTKTQ